MDATNECPEFLQSAANYFTDTAPTYSLAVDREGVTRTAVRSAKAKGLEEEKCFELMLTHWLPRCEPQWESEEDLRERVRAAYQDETPLDAEDLASDGSQNEPWIAEMNKRFFVVNSSGKVLVYKPSFDYALKRNVLEHFSFEDLKRLFLNDRVELGKGRGGQPNYITRAEAWLAHKRRRQYAGGVTFAPGETVTDDVYNLWQGFAIKPKKGKWTRLRTHISKVICDGDPVSEQYLINWLARLFQKPGEQGRVAVVLRGARGTGKGTLGNFILRILGQHGLYVTHAKHLVGNFNAHLRDAVFVFADEAFYAGDKQHESVLKGLITDPYLTIEAKYQNAVTAKNVTHLLLASNDSWVVPSGADERRYFVRDVSPEHQQDAEYFRKLHEEAANGGLAAMLHDLLRHDITGFNVDDVPQTVALAEQKIHSLRGTEAWLFDCLSRSAIGGEAWQGKGLAVTKDDAYASYELFSAKQKEFRPADRRVWGRRVLEILKPIEVRKKGDAFTRSRCWEFSPLEKCRENFCKFLRVSKLEWDPDSVEDAQLEQPFIVGGANADVG